MLHPGQVILEVDGTNIRGMSNGCAVLKLRQAYSSLQSNVMTLLVRENSSTWHGITPARMHQHSQPCTRIHRWHRVHAHQHSVCISYCNCCTETAADISRRTQFEAVNDLLYKLVSGAMHYYGLTPIYFRVLSCCKSVTCSAAMNWTRTLHVRS